MPKAKLTTTQIAMITDHLMKAGKSERFAADPIAIDMLLAACVLRSLIHSGTITNGVEIEPPTNIINLKDFIGEED